MSTERDNVKAGLFVLVGLVLAVGIILSLSNFSNWFQPRQTIQVSFRLSDGVQGLREGGVVTLGDQPVGLVTKIGNITEGGDEQAVRVTAKLVTFTIPRQYILFKDAVVELYVPTIGTGTRLNIASVGRGQPYKPGDIIPAGVAPNLLARQLVQELGIRDEQRQQLQEILANFRDLTAQGKDVMNKAQPLIDRAQSALADARQSMDDIRNITAQVRAKLPPWLERVDTITANADQSIASIRGLLKDTDAQLRQTVDNMHQITQSVRNKTLAQVNEALAKADEAVTNLKKSTEDLHGFIAGQRPVLERAIANAQLTTDQLKLAAIEVRRSPWRLLYSPSDKELETDNLYDAARSFAQAAGALDAAALSLRAVAADKDHAGQVKPMLDHLTALFQKYEQAEDAFWKALKDRTPGQQGQGSGK